ncbi:MAG: hypothetical protein RJA26_1149 [Actinomycetota bacterium]
MLRSTKVLTALSSAALLIAGTTATYYVVDTLNGRNTTLGQNLKVIGFCPTGSSLAQPTVTAIAGSPGPTGATGPAGSPGPTGATGKTGKTGATGATGAQGATGATSATGATGAQGETGATGATGETGATGATGPMGACTADLAAITGDLVPSIDNTYTLGTAAFRWKGLQLGPGTLYIQDQTTGLQAGLTVDNGALLIDGADSLRLGNVQLTKTGLRSVLADQDITIGNAGDTGFLAVPRGIRFQDGTILTTASGAQGPAGARGETGATGAVGPTGPAGTAGAKGDIGDTGPRGLPGAQGDTGAKGDTGATGAKGDKGDTGNPGTALQVSTPTGGSKLNLTDQLFTLGDGTFILLDGSEGQLIHFAMATGTTHSKVFLSVEHLRWLDKGLSKVAVDGSWSPFDSNGAASVVTLAEAIFTHGAWSVTGGLLN